MRFEVKEAECVVFTINYINFTKKIQKFIQNNFFKKMNNTRFLFGNGKLLTKKIQLRGNEFFFTFQ